MVRMATGGLRRALQVDEKATKARLARLRAYMTAQVLSPRGFCCGSEGECRASIRPGDRFLEGQLSHVGHSFDLSLAGKPLRVVVVGQEYGMWYSADRGQFERRSVSLDQRYRMIHDGSGLKSRYYAGDGHPGRNPHMRGTTSALRILFGNGLGADWEGEFVTSVNGERFQSSMPSP